MVMDSSASDSAQKASSGNSKVGPLKGLCLSSGLLVLLLLLLEAGSYIFGRVDTGVDPLITGVEDYYGERDGSRQADPLLFWSFRPNEANFNNLGLRGPDVGAKQPGEYRVLSLGESSTMAARLEYEECYSDRLEKKLAQATDRPVRVINAGIAGYTLFQGKTYLEHRGLDLEPDAVVLYFGKNDFLPISYLKKRTHGDPSRGQTDRELFEELQANKRSWGARLAEWSNLYRMLIRWRDAGKREEIKGEVLLDDSEVRVPAKDRRMLLSSIHEMCSERGIPLVVMIPWYFEFNEHPKLLKAFAKQSGVPSVDLPAKIPPLLTKKKSEYFLDAVHPNAEGHRLIADCLAEVMLPLLAEADRSD